MCALRINAVRKGALSCSFPLHGPAADVFRMPALPWCYSAGLLVLDFATDGRCSDAEVWSRREVRHTRLRAVRLEVSLGGRAQIGVWTQRARREGRYPLPGAVDVVTGGPPCQGMSGLNRHAASTGVLEDTRSPPPPPPPPGPPLHTSTHLHTRF